MNLNQVTVPCLDIHESIEFYKKLGLELIVHTHDNYARFLCPKGNSTFSLHRVERQSSNNIWVYFEVEDVSKKVTELKELGLHFDQDTTEQPWLWTEARLLDPYGNLIIIYSAGENRVNPPWRISE